MFSNSRAGTNSVEVSSSIQMTDTSLILSPLILDETDGYPDLNSNLYVKTLLHYTNQFERKLSNFIVH